MRMSRSSKNRGVQDTYRESQVVILHIERCIPQSCVRPRAARVGQEARGALNNTDILTVFIINHARQGDS